MYYAVTFYPQLSSRLSESIAAFRREYDPTWRLIEPHIGICFPATDSLDEQLLADHVDHVLSSWSPFVVRLGGFHKSRDHWLSLALLEGADQIKKLNTEMYTEYLATFRKEPGKPGSVLTPHLGLGHFLRQGCAYDWRNPQESDFDSLRYERAFLTAATLPLPESVMVEKLHITAIPDVVTQWTTGKRIDLPDEAKMFVVGEFRLGCSGS